MMNRHVNCIDNPWRYRMMKKRVFTRLHSELIGLGKMGSHMVTRIVQCDHQVVAFDLDRDAVSTDRT
jgi:hypothetical protein